MKESILHIVHASYPSQSGYVIRTERILDSLSKRNYKICVVGSIFSKRYEQLAHGVKFIHKKRLYFQLLNKPLLHVLVFFGRIPVIRVVLKQLEILLNTAIILARVKVKDYKIIHGHSTYRNGISAFIVAKLFSKFFVYDIHALRIDALKPSSFEYKLGYFFEKLLIQNATAIIAIDKSLERDLREIFNIDKKKIFVAPNGIDMEVFVNNKNYQNKFRDLNLPNEKLIIGIDNSKPVEGFELILNNVEEILSILPNVHFLVFGDKINTLQTEHLTYLPKTLIEEMPKYYSMVDLFILPRVKHRQSDTITPLKILELMSCEVPVLVSDVEGLTHCIQHGQTGYVFNQNTVQGLTEAIKFVIEDKNIPKITSNARKWVRENKSWASAVEKYCDCYEYINRIEK